ncbi:MAG: glycosyltransferase family 2 protein [DPANN group archaeon]|nr:glycosyltransferase family 2 protein [DPANN group archaeon]
MKSISLIIPAYNEEKNIIYTIDRLYNFLQNNKIDYEEIIITEDGSSDSTAEVIRKNIPNYKGLRLITRNKNVGRGFALTNALKEAKGEYALYMDVDLATDLHHIKDAIAHLNNGSSIAVGSRYLASGTAKRTFKRAFFSKVFNLATRIILNSDITDHQCGFKAFKRSDIIPLLDKLRDMRWFWDTEIIIKAKRAGLKVTEFPVVWEEQQATNVRIARDSGRMFSGILKVWLELNRPGFKR